MSDWIKSGLSYLPSFHYFANENSENEDLKNAKTSENNTTISCASSFVPEMNVNTKHVMNNQNCEIDRKSNENIKNKTIMNASSKSAKSSSSKSPKSQTPSLSVSKPSSNES